MKTPKNCAGVGRWCGTLAKAQRTSALRAIGAALIVLLLVGCGGSQAVPTSTAESVALTCPAPLARTSTATSVPPRATSAASEAPDPATVTAIAPGAATTAPPMPRSVPAHSLVITNGTVIDGTGADPISEGIVIVAGDRIVAVGRASDWSIPPAARVIDAQGGTILPGFINAHVHQGYHRGQFGGLGAGRRDDRERDGRSRFSARDVFLSR